MTKLDPRTTALLVMDLQNDIVAMLGDASGPVVAHNKELVTAARKVKIPVLFVTVAFSPGYPEVSPHNAMFSRITASGAFVAGSKGTQVVDALEATDADVYVIKRRVSAFAGSNLEVILRAKEIKTLVLTGLATSGVVLSTLRQAADLDYQIVVAADACGDRDEEVHRVLTQKVFPGQATVLSTAEVVAAFTS